MISDELKKYMVDNNLEPMHIEIQSNSPGKASVPCFYLKHPVSGLEYKELSALTKGTWTSCVLDVHTLLLVPTVHLGPSISILDAIQAATDHRLGKTTPRAITIIGPSLAELKAEMAAEKTQSEPTKNATEEEAVDVVKKKATKKKATKKKTTPP